MVTALGPCVKRSIVYNQSLCHTPIKSCYRIGTNKGLGGGGVAT